MGIEMLNEDLAVKLVVLEEIYQRSLVKRKELIRIFGPSVDKIDPFPKNREFYTLWDFFTPSFSCPHSVERIGVPGDGGKYVCGLSRIAEKKSCVIYSFGINDESSFEAELLQRARGCQVWGYDFSVERFGPEVSKNRAIAGRSHFAQFGISGKDAHTPLDNPAFYTLPTLMEMNGHDHIDILKIDIEGSEFSLLSDLLDHYGDRPLPFGQLQIEIHARQFENWENTFPEFLKWWERLEKAGLRPFWTEPNLVYANINRGTAPDLAEYSFINIRGDHDLIRGPVVY